MGCDIHSFAEVKVRGKWETVGRVFPCSYHESNRPTTITRYSGDDIYESNQVLSMEPYGDRNYRLFAILAGVRGTDDIVPIDQPRGIPTDASSYIKDVVESWGYDGHSHSWFSLSELEAYDWTSPHPDGGYVTVKGYEQLKENGRPSSWCGGAVGAKVVIVTNEVMDHILLHPPMDGKSYYTYVTWEWAPVESTRTFVERTIPALQALREKEGVEDVRFVFFFDN